MTLWSHKESSVADRKSTRLNSSHSSRSYAVFCLKKKKGGARRGPGEGGPGGSSPAEPDPAERVTAAAIFFFNDAAPTEIYTLSLHDALPISRGFRGCDHGRTHSELDARAWPRALDRKSTRLNSSHSSISYAVFCLKKKN